MLSSPSTAIIIGATSGIGKALAQLLAKNHYTLGLAGRRKDQLETLQQQLNTSVYIEQMDITNVIDSEIGFKNLVTHLKKVDFVFITAGIGYINESLTPALEIETIQTNCTGFANMAIMAFNLFVQQGYGHLIGISSIAGLRGNAESPAYSASKAFVSNYLEGLHLKALKRYPALTITDIQPGFVDTPMAQGDGLFWVASPEKVAKQILTAVRQKKAHVYVTKRWELIAFLLKRLPTYLLLKLQ